MRACLCCQRHALKPAVSCVHHPPMDIHSPVLICQGRADHCLCPPASLQKPSSDCRVRSPPQVCDSHANSKLRATPHQDGALGVQATIEFHLTMDPSASKYESGSTLGLQLPNLHCYMSLAICRNGSKGASASKPALKRTFPKSLIKTVKLMASPNVARTARSSPLHASCMYKVTLLGSPCRAQALSE